MEYRLLFVEDDIRFAREFSRGLVGFASVTVATSATDGLKRASEERFSAILVDLNLDGEVQGLSIVRVLQERLASPVLVFTSDNSLETRLNALKVGVSDFLWKTMVLDEVKLRISNCIRNFGDNGHPELGEGNLTLDSSLLKVRVDSTSIDLTRTEVRVLKSLLSEPSRRVSRSEFIHRVWGTQHVSDGAVSTALYQLNRKLSAWDCRVSGSSGREVRITPRKTDG